MPVLQGKEPTSSSRAAPGEPRWVLAVHGGAGDGIVRSPRTRIEAAERGLAAALRAGADVLRHSGGAVEAVVAAVTVLEDDRTFNAGRGRC